MSIHASIAKKVSDAAQPLAAAALAPVGARIAFQRTPDANLFRMAARVGKRCT